MSLVNQMLRDLEKRRAAERHGSGTVFDGLVATSESRGARPGLFIGLSVLVIALGGLAGYLLWERRAHAPTDPELVRKVATLEAAVVAPPAEPASTVLVTPGFVALEPAPERKVEPVVVGDATPAPASVSRKRAAPAPVAVAPVPTSGPVAAVAPVAAEQAQPEAPAMIEKKALPPTPEQLAAIAWQKGYEALGAGQREEAERHLREALRNDPGHVQARESLAGLLLTAGRRVEAGEVLEAGLKLKPEVGSFRKLNARLHVEQGDLPGAIATLEAGASGAARDGEYQALMGALYQRQGAFARSVQRYEQALLLDPNQSLWWLGLAISSEGAGQKGDAITSYQRALAGGLGEKLSAWAAERLKVLEADKKR